MKPETIRDYTLDKFSLLDCLTARIVCGIVCIFGTLLLLHLLLL